MKVQSIEEIKKYLLGRVRKVRGCWLWRGGQERGGYALCWAMGRQHRAARLSFMVFRGPIPPGHQVHHTCPNRHCINPEHLEAKERRAHFRLHAASGTWRGERNSQAKLTDADAQFIRVAGPLVKAQTLADQFEVSLRTIHYIRSGRTWRHVGLPNLPQRTLPEVIQHCQAVARQAVDVLLNLQELRRERGEPQPPFIEESIILARACAGGL